MRTLLFDLGNTRLKWLLTDSVSGTGCEGMMANSDISSDALLLPESWRSADRVLAASVSGEAIKVEFARRLLTIGLVVDYWAVSRKQTCGVTCAYVDPSSLGVDRWLAMVAAQSLTDEAFCVIDCGSAITMDVVDRYGRHQGGFIMPGVRLQMESLRHSTALLSGRYEPEICHSPGTTTGECISRGVGVLLSGIDHWLKRWSDSGPVVSRRIFLTGGDAELLAAVLEVACEIRPRLVFEGLLIQANHEAGTL